MAINISKLVLSPPIQQNIIDPITREPAIGKIYYYKSGTTELKPVYMRTGDPLNPYVVTPNPDDLDSAGALQQDIFFYPYDEDDENIVQLYDVVIKRLDDTIIIQRLEWPPSGASGGTVTGTSGVLNLCPNYDFNSTVNEDIYSVSPVRNSPVSVAWGIFLAQENPNSSNITYSFSLLNEQDPTVIDQTPLNLMTLRATSSVAPTGYRRLYYNLGTYNVFQNQYIAISRWLANVLNTPSIEVQLVRTKNGALQPPINLGALTIPTNTPSLCLLNVFIPPISEAGYIEDDSAFLVFSLPQDQDFAFSMTGNWDQVVPDANTVGTPVTLPLGISRANSFFQESDLNDTGNDPNFTNAQDNDGFALTISNGKRDSIYSTGVLMQVLDSSADRINNALEITSSEDQLIYWNKTPSFFATQYPKLSRANRLIQELQASNLNNKHAFGATLVSPSSVSVSLFSGAFLTPWTTNNPSAFTFTTSSNAYPYGIIPTAVGSNQLKLQYTENWSVQATYSQDWFYSTGILNHNYAINPVANIRNWFGSYNVGTTYEYGNQKITQSIVPAGAGLGVGLLLTFTSTILTDYIPKVTTQSYSIPINIQTSYTNFIEIPSENGTIYGKPYSNEGSFGLPSAVLTPGNTHLVFTQETSSNNYLKGSNSTITVEIDSSILSVLDLITKTVQMLSGSVETTVNVLQMPTNGDVIFFSNDVENYVLQFAYEGQSPPTPPSTTNPVFVLRIPFGTTIDGLRNLMVQYFPLLVRALPSLTQMGLTLVSGTTYMLTL